MKDFSVFSTDFKKLSLEFLVFKDIYPIRTEGISFIQMIISACKQNENTINQNENINAYFYDELMKSIKNYKLLKNEFLIIKSNIKGNKVKNVFIFLSMLLVSKDIEISNMIIDDNGKEVLNYAINKDVSLCKLFPDVMKFLKDNIIS